MSRSVIRLAVVGDSGVGKTSLIIALCNESFSEGCPPVLPPTRMPASYLPFDLPFEVIDTCTRPEERVVLEQTCLSADAILLLFASASAQSLKRIETHWLPEFRRIGVKAPILLIASKTDLSHQSMEEIKAGAQPIMEKYREIQVCYQCSAKLLKHVSEVFHYGMEAVVNPIRPIFVPEANDGSGALTALCIRALRRIFIMADKDKDGALNDEELNNFQMAVFSAPLQPEEMIGIHQMVAHDLPQGVNAAGLTLTGFLYLQAIFIERGQPQSVWAVLRRYGYNNELLLDTDYLEEVNFQHNPDQVVEMTEAGKTFLREKFRDFDFNRDSLIDSREEVEMFETAPHSPWRGEVYQAVMVETGKTGQGETGLTLRGFLSKWAYMTASDPTLSLAYIRYLGFEGPAAPLFNISKSKRQERNLQQLQRNIVRGFVVLGDGVGRGVLLKGLCGKQLQADEDSSIFTAIGEVQKADSGQGTSSTIKTVILQEIEAEDLYRLKQETLGLQAADFVLLASSSSNLRSIYEAEGSLMEIAQATDDTMPCLLIDFSEGQTPTQEAIQEYGRLIAKLDLRQPMEVSQHSTYDVDNVLQSVLDISEAPEKHKAIPQTPRLKARKEYQRTLRRSLYFLGGSIVVGAACYAVYNAFQKQEAQGSTAVEQFSGGEDLSGHNLQATASQTQPGH